MFWILLVSIFLGVLLPTECRMAEEMLPKEDITPPPPTPVAEPPPSPIPHSNTTCFSAPKELCPTGPSPCRFLDPQSLLCCDINATRMQEGLNAIKSNQFIVNLHIRNAMLEELDMSQIYWRRAYSISITDGNISRIVGDFLKYSPASCLNVSNNGLTNISSRSLSNLFNLTTLDVSDNQLTEIPNFPSAINKNLFLNIRGNKMLCKSVLDAMNKTSAPLKFIDANVTNCTSSKTFHWFNTTEHVPITQIEVIHELKNDCPEVSSTDMKCKCEMVRVDILPDKPTVFSVGVDCSNMQLKQLPDKLPPNTIRLNISNNNITSLAAIADHPSSYESMRELYADNNHISSIKELEGTKFIDVFAVLSLKGNKLKSIPTYILSNTLDRLEYNTLTLGYNYLTCDCASAKVFKSWLIDKAQHIPDYTDVYCDTGEKVINLNENILCQQPKNWTHYIVYIIIIEVILLVGLVTKVSYDYWIFKTVGYLPWPASKMPKLPCDWLCE